MKAIEGYWAGSCNLSRWRRVYPVTMAQVAQWMITKRRSEGVVAVRGVERWQSEFRRLLANCPAVTA
jgi:hypothetical protein